LEWATVLWNVIEAVVAIGSGAVTGSAALIAFGADSLIEVSSAVVVLWRLIRAGPDAPLDEQLELDRRAHLLVGVTFFLLAAYVLVDAGLAVFRHTEPERSAVGIILAIASLIAMPILATLKQRTGKAMGSRALEADAIETWLCAYLSGTLLLGLGLNAWLGWWWADPAAALAMVPFMAWQGWGAVEESRSDE
jgi:divalent metal cation (Fe/Co/Zn/Cd) transporter